MVDLKKRIILKKTCFIPTQVILRLSQIAQFFSAFQGFLFQLLIILDITFNLYGYHRGTSISTTATIQLFSHLIWPAYVASNI